MLDLGNAELSPQLHNILARLDSITDRLETVVTVLEAPDEDEEDKTP